MTGSLQFNQVVFSADGGGVFLLPSGSALIGHISSSATSQAYIVSMSANSGKYHTPEQATASYYTVSASNLSEDQSYNIYYYNTGSQYINRIQVGPNSSSLTSSYGSLSGDTFHISGSQGAGASYDHVYHFYYSIPDVLTRASSSAITITSFSGSQSAFGQDQYQFHVSSSGGYIYKLIPTGSENIGDYSERVESLSGSFLPFKFFHSGSTGSDGTPISGSTISEGIASLAKKVNEYSSSIGVTATASATTIQFNALNAGVDSTYSFMTQSLTHHVTSSQFVFSIGTHISSSIPAIGASSASVHEIPLDVSASTFNVATASANVINTVSDFSASVSASGASLYGIVVQHNTFSSHGEISGSSTPAFTYTIEQSGSYPPLEPNPGNGAVPIRVDVPYDASQATMISESIDQINLFMIDQNPTFITASFRDSLGADAGDPSGSTFHLMLAPGKISDPAKNIDVTYARGISSSFLASGSGLRDRPGEIPGTVDINVAKGSFNIDPLDKSSIVISGSTALYMSSSGRIGMGTEDPLADIDLRADRFQVQKTNARKGIRVNEEGNIESFSNDSAAAATGSEFILSFTRGVTINEASMEAITGINFASDEAALDYYNSLGPDEQQSILIEGEQIGLLGRAAAGDTLGAIRWVAASGSQDFNEDTSDFDMRSSGEAANITAVVDSISSLGTTADMIFKVAGEVQNPPIQVFVLDAGQAHQLTGSLNVSSDIYGNNFRIAGNIVGDDSTNITNIATIECDNVVHDGDVDTKIAFGADSITMTAGGADLITLTETSENTIALGAKISTHITASGNISSSGTIISANVEHIQFSFQTDQGSDTNWRGPNRQGPSNYYWNRDFGNDSGVQTIGWSSISDERMLNTGYRIPYPISITKVFVYCTGNLNNTPRTMTSSLLIGNPEIDSPLGNSITLEQKCFFSSSTAASRYAQMTGSQEFAYGDFIVSESQWVYPRIKASYAGNDLNGQFQIQYKRI